MLPEQRIFKRFNILCPVEFIPAKEPSLTFFGIVNNFSCRGFCLETLYLGPEPGETLGFIFKDPENNVLVSYVGTVVWKDKAWKNMFDKFACLMGIELIEKDVDTRLKMPEILSAAGNIHVDSLFVERTAELSSGEKEITDAILNDSREEDFISGLPEKGLGKTVDDDSAVNKLFNIENSPSSSFQSDSTVGDIPGSGENIEETEQGKSVYEKPSDISTRGFVRKQFRQETHHARHKRMFKRRKQKNKTSRHVLIIIAISLILFFALPAELKNLRNDFNSQLPAPDKLTTGQAPEKNISAPSPDTVQPDELIQDALPYDN